MATSVEQASRAADVPADVPVAAPVARRPVAPSPLATAWLVARKDLTIEVRTRSAFFAAIVFALLAVAVFHFSWDPTAVSAIDLTP